MLKSFQTVTVHVNYTINFIGIDFTTTQIKFFQYWKSFNNFLKKCHILF